MVKNAIILLITLIITFLTGCDSQQEKNAQEQKDREAKEQEAHEQALKGKFTKSPVKEW